MKKTTLLWMVLPMCGLMTVSPTLGKDKSLEGLVSEWMKLMQERQKIEDKWRENKQILENTRDGLKAEIAEVSEDIERAKKRSNKWDAEKKEHGKQRELYDNTKKWVVEQLPSLEARAVVFKNKFPASVLRGNVKLASALEALEKRVGNETPPKEGMSNRLNRVILVLNEANKFNQTLKVVQEKRQHAGKDVQLTVMYLGFSQAYATNEGRTVALHGICGRDGWKFSESTGKADQIWKAIQMAKGEEDVDFVELPVVAK